jgi:Amidase
MSVATATELWRLSATELAEAIRSRQISSHEVIQAHLRRIEAVNPSINAVTVVLGEQALEAAKAADRAVADGDPLPPFHGVPFTVKGNIDLVGTPTTHGAKALVGAFPTLDAPVVERLKAAGAIPIGRTNLPTFALRWHTDSELYGPTINPWDRSRTAGASSAGEAAALATGMSPLGLGNDGLGSLRHPAQCCGISALKPTLGRIPDATTTAPADWPIGAQLVDVQGPLARRVADLCAALEVLAGPTWRDPWSVPAPLRGPEPTKLLRVALVVDPAGQGTATQVQDEVRKAAKVGHLQVGADGAGSLRAGQQGGGGGVHGGVPAGEQGRTLPAGIVGDRQGQRPLAGHVGDEGLQPAKQRVGCGYSDRACELRVQDRRLPILSRLSDSLTTEVIRCCQDSPTSRCAALSSSLRCWPAAGPPRTWRSSSSATSSPSFAGKSRVLG